MKDESIPALRETFGYNALEVVPEFEYPGGRTDLVLVNVSDDYWKRRRDRLSLSTPISDRKQLQTFLQLQGREAVTREYFLEIGALKRRYKREALNWLIDNGFVEDIGNKIRTTPSIRQHVTTSIAVELKLKNWKRALKQANGSRAYANYRFVAVDKDHLNPALKHLHEFEKRGVGLISINQDGDCNVHFSPHRTTPYSSLHTWKLNEQTVDILAA